MYKNFFFSKFYQFVQIQNSNPLFFKTEVEVIKGQMDTVQL